LPPNHRSVPTRIRGITYPSMRAAADAIGVSYKTVWSAVESGRADSCGLGLGPRAGKPHRFAGTAYPSRRQAYLAAERAHPNLGHVALTKLLEPIT